MRLPVKNSHVFGYLLVTGLKPFMEVIELKMFAKNYFIFKTNIKVSKISVQYARKL